MKNLPVIDTVSAPLTRCFSPSELAPALDTIHPMAWTAAGFAVASVALLATVVVQFVRIKRKDEVQVAAAPQGLGLTESQRKTTALDIWDEMNRRFGAVQIGAVEHAIAAHGYYFGDQMAEEEQLPLQVRLAAADELMREREAYLYPRSSADELAKAVKDARESGYSLTMVDAIVSASRLANKFVQRRPMHAELPKCDEAERILRNPRVRVVLPLEDPPSSTEGTA